MNNELTKRKRMELISMRFKQLNFQHLSEFEIRLFYNFDQ